MANPENTSKSQRFLLSPECRTLTVLDLAKMRDTTAYNWFKRLRGHETEGEPRPRSTVCDDPPKNLA